MKHIDYCEKEWKELGYHDERILPHIFPSILNDLPKNGRKLKNLEETHSTRNHLKKPSSRTSHLI